MQAETIQDRIAAFNRCPHVYVLKDVGAFPWRVMVGNVDDLCGFEQTRTPRLREALRFCADSYAVTPVYRVHDDGSAHRVRTFFR